MENPIEMDQNWGYLHDLENLHLLLQLQMYPDELKLLRVHSIYIIYNYVYIYILHIYIYGESSP